MAPNLSLLCPSRGDLSSFDKMLESLQRTTVEPKNIELILRLDDDDPDLPERIALVDKYNVIPIQMLIGPRMPMGLLQIQMGMVARGSHLWLVNDDIIHETSCWDRLVSWAIRDRPRHVFFPDDGLFGSTLVCFPLIPKIHIDATDFFGVGRYERYCIDTIISDVYNGLSYRDSTHRMLYLPQWKITHLNVRDSSEVDLTKWHCVALDGRVYQPPNLDVLERDVQRHSMHLAEKGYLMSRIDACDLAAVAS